jgi:ABC transport system ATP-binding/permease protein
VSVLVDAAGISVRRADRILFEEMSLTVTDGDRLGVVGINGTGKSTLLRVLAGIEVPQAGQVRRGRGVRVGILHQDASLPEGTVRQAVGGGWEGEAILDRLDMAAMRDYDLSDISGGQAKRVALARVLADPAELLILDEPTNHLDLPGIAWLEAWLSRFAGGVLLVTHDRHLLDRVTTRMVELDRGHAYVHDTGYAGYLAAKAERAERAVDAETTRRNLARRELAWLRRGAPARSRKPQARVDAARRLLGTGPEAAAQAAPLDMGFATPRLGTEVIAAEEVSFRYHPESEPVLVGVSLALAPRERLGVVGPNGSGKSTLLEILAGWRAPLAGSVKQGPTVRIGYYSQQGPDIEATARVRDLVAGPTRAPGDPVDQRLMERFWFAGELSWATAGTLSGGERRRLQLLLVLAERPNVLLLDEPTNDLDLDTLRALEDFLEDWPGCLVTVSHDRTFLDRVTDRIVACRDRQIREVPGGLGAWIAEVTATQTAGSSRRPTPAPASDRPRARPAAGGRGVASPRSPTTISFELRRLDKDLGRLTRERDRLADAFEAAADHRDLAQIGGELAAAQAQLDAAEERWLVLAEEAETPR